MSGPPSILVVDDDQRNREMLAEALSEAGFTVDVACDGIEALSKANAGWCVAQASLTPEKLAGMIKLALSNPDDLAKRAASAHALAKLDAVSRLADLAENLAGAK